MVAQIFILLSHVAFKTIFHGVCVYISMANIRLIIFIYRISIMYHFSNRSNRGRAHRYNRINLYYREVVHNLIYKCDASSILSSCMLIL